MNASPAAVATLRTLLTAQRLAVLATQQNGHPYTSLVAFVASDDLRRIAFMTSRTTTKYRNLFAAPRVSMLIDSRTHSVEDFSAGAAVTVLGRAAEIVDKRGAALLERFQRKHPHLEAFAQAPTTALCGVDVEKYFLVTQFQQVVEIRISECSSLNP
jgi:nitroimidazol reductase NimA-like FMN-containing flavoprotein (pyridoxamine 5'-phosphate oxidase superfamily)